MGNSLAIMRPAIDQCWPPKPQFSPDQIPDLTGRVVAITGGNSGIGKETVKALLQHNAKVYLGARNKSKAEAAIKELKEETGKEAIFWEIDLSSLAAVRKGAEEFLRYEFKEKELHILFLNAGIMWSPLDQFTPDGYDLQWGTNIVAHFLLTKLLMPALLAGKETSPDHHARIITTSSTGAYFYPWIQWDSFKDHPIRHKMGTKDIYFQSKFAGVVVAKEFAKRYGGDGIISISVNPGNLKTNLQQNASSFEYKILSVLLLYPAPLGALTQLWGGTMPEALNYNGGFLIPWARVGKPPKQALDNELGEKLWNYLENEVKDYLK
ncbi:unnamed protein product [Somion occarium]|uniref:NAD(P)-binding protein n=1 Tax=Somion occarium TaxID=3059160 RepID=A0ABP1CZH4_9APHY